MEGVGVFVEEGSKAARDAIEVYFRPLLLAAGQTKRWRIWRYAPDGSRHLRHDAQVVESSLRKRLSDLENIAVSDGITLSRDSEADLTNFLRTAVPKQRPSLFLLENGNFRAVWKGNAGEQVGLQFLGKGEVQFVIFACRHDPELTIRSSGRDTLKGILRVIEAFELAEFMWDER